MDKQAAVKIIRDTFESSFDKGRFITFSKNLVNYLDDSKNFTYRGNIIPDAYELYIHTLERIGKYQDANDNKIDILIAQLKKETSLERARTMQRNFIAWYLNGSRGGDLKDAAVVAFVSPDSEDWRFSLVKMDYLLEESPSGKTKVKTELTPARRFSFLVGENESSHTAQSQLVDILADDRNNPTLSILENAFNIEVATREFFNRYRQLFHKVQESLDELAQQDEAIREDFKDKGVNTVNFSKKLLGQVIFLYFLQKKGWLGVPGNKNWGEGNKKFLRTLFEKCKKERKNFFNDYLEYLFYAALNNEDRGGIDPSYYPRFECRIPFLNGGLFTSDYDWEKTKIVIPNDIFSDRRDDNDEGSGILDIFDLYNFTVKEDEPLEKEVAVDPEMLGKVFENLLEVKDRKSKGTYYTPREIVHYMCQESLINYLDTAVNTGEVPLVPTRPPQGKLFGKPDPEQVALKAPQYRVLVPRQDIEEFVRKGEATIEHDSRVVRYGRETGRYSYKLPESIRQNVKLVDQKLADIRVCDPAVGSGAFLVGIMTEIIRARNTLTTYLADEKGRNNFNFKRHAIQNCLYGVDIDPGAVEIAKLRLWLSLVVDEEDIKQIKPLPNLDYKIVCGNSLLGVEKNLFNLELFNEFEKQKLLYFDETDVKKKQEYKSQIDDLIRQITNNNETFDFEVYFSEVFHEKGGFDVVIANPPYIEHKKLRALRELINTKYKTHSGTADIYVYFYEKGLRLLKNHGVLAFISSNKFLKTGYGSKLRSLLTNYHLLQIVDFTEVHVFDALVATCIVIVAKEKADASVLVTSANDNIQSFTYLYEFINRTHQLVSSKNLGSEIWQLSEGLRLRIKSKIETNSKRLKDIVGVHIYRGLTTGCNEAFIIGEDTAKVFLKSDPRNLDIAKPLLQGRNIKKWQYIETNSYILQTGYDSDLRKYPKIFMHLTRFKTKLMGRADQGKKWWNLRACVYYAEFEKEKIIWGLTANKWAFAYDNEGHYLPSNGYILTSLETPIKYLLALLNSRLMEFYFSFVGIMTAGGAFTLKYETIGELPVKELPLSKQELIINLVDQILAMTKGEDYLTNSSKQAKVKEYERQIDQMVYQLYNLTPEEIAVVEGLDK